MKNIIRVFLLFVSINISSFIQPEKATAQSVSFQVFYDDLSPYGNWIESPEYGYVWNPRVSGFSPYSTNGYWVLTDYGWTWVSDYSWGWAPFHYGRWYYDPFYGYVWVPGYEWGPGWVTWRRSDSYYGWAPIGPGVNISVAYSNGYNIPYNHWNFVSCNNFGRRDIHNYYIDRSKNVTIINNTTVINNTRVDNTRKTTFTPGPDRLEVQKKVGRTINPVAIVDENKPVQRVTKNAVQLYRPVIERDETKKAVPAKVTPVKEGNTPVNNTRKQRDDQQLNAEGNTRRNDQKQEIKQQEQVPKKQMRDEKNLQPIKQAPVRDKKDVRDNNATAPVQQPIRKPVRDEQSIEPVKQQKVQPVERPVQQPPAEQQRVRKPVRDEQPVQQRVQKEPVERPVQQPPVQQQVQQELVERPVQQPPVQQRPDRQRNMDQPVRQAPVHQQPIRQAPVQRAVTPPPVKDRKGG